MRNSLSIPIADGPVASALADDFEWLESALARATAGLTCAGAMAVAITQLGSAGIPVSCVLAVLAIGLKIHVRLRYCATARVGSKES